MVRTLSWWTYRSSRSASRAARPCSGFQAPPARWRRKSPPLASRPTASQRRTRLVSRPCSWKHSRGRHAQTCPTVPSTTESPSHPQFVAGPAWRPFESVRRCGSGLELQGVCIDETRGWARRSPRWGSRSRRRAPARAPTSPVDQVVAPGSAGSPQCCAGRRTAGPARPVSPSGRLHAVETPRRRRCLSCPHRST